MREGFVITIERDGDRLLAQATGQPQFEIFPRSETEFFFKVVDATIHFVTGPHGRATELVLHPGGAEMTAERLD